MSAYLIDQIGDINNISLIPFTSVTACKGDHRLRSICLKQVNEGTEEWKDLGALFIFIGAKPHTEWLPSNILRDERGSVLTGRDLKQHPEFGTLWKEPREPEHLETSLPGVFAAGDIRSGAMNRVASAVGEGAMSISMVHTYLQSF